MSATGQCFRGVLLDPPWPETGGGKIKRGCDRHYKPIKTRAGHLAAIVTTTEWSMVDPTGSHLWMWSTSNYESWAHWLIDALGYRHKVSLPWVKAGRAGIGQYFRGCHETLMFAVRGKGYSVRTDSRSIRSDALVGVPRVLDAQGKIIHSAKPPEAFDLVEQRTHGPWLEMYAREHSPAVGRDGWTMCGDQAKGPD